MTTKTTGRKGSFTHRRKTQQHGRDEYLDLVTAFPPRPIRDGEQYDQTVAAMNKLAIRDEDSLSDAEHDYLMALTRFVEDYDERAFLASRKKRAPLQALKLLMEQTGMSTADLGRLLGNSGLASMIVNGKRELSKAHIRLLADHFKVDAGLFI